MNNDIIIVGGGVVGLTLAALLSMEKFSVVMLERQMPLLEWDKEKTDLRVRAINRASENIFKTIGVWDTIEQLGISRYRGMHVWDSERKGDISFSCFDMGEENLGCIIENRVLIKALWMHLEKQKNVKLIASCTIKNFQINSDNVTVACEADDNLSAKLLIAADGAHSWVRNQLGVPLIKKSYDQAAIVTTVQTEVGHDKTARQVFLPEGTLALLPLSNEQHCSVVWATTPSQVEKLLAQDDEQFNEAITRAFEKKCGAIKVIDQRISFPLNMQHIERYTDHRIAFVGDAAHTFHPLAGQGLNLGLLDAATLAEVIAKYSHELGCHHVLRKYERWRKGQNWMMIAAMEGLKRLFTSRNTLLGQLRSIGLSGVNKLPLVKNFCIQHAMGLQGDLPDAARLP